LAKSKAEIRRDDEVIAPFQFQLSLAREMVSPISLGNFQLSAFIWSSTISGNAFSRFHSKVKAEIGKAAQ
jgi:hypothetical protein